jgi:tetratricopeptide (TPR) repeat protein/predicted aspartyl protease
MNWQSFACVAALAVTLASERSLAACSLSKYAEFPVTMSGDMPVINGTINGHAARFGADTGSFFNMINSQKAEAFSMKIAVMPTSLEVVGGMGGTSKARRGIAADFTLEGFGSAPRHNFEFVVLGDRFGDVDGLIGQNWLGRNDAEFDLRNGVIRLFLSNGCEKASLAYWAKDAPVSIVELEPRNPVESQFIGSATLNGKKIRLMFDTGAGRSVLSLRTATRLGFRPNGEGVEPGGISGGIGKRDFETWIARFDSLQIGQIGNEQVKNARMRVGDFGNALDVDGIIGVDFFLSHRIYAATEQRRIYITYNGGPVFDLRNRTGTTAAANNDATDSVSEPSDAAGYRRRGAAFASRRDYEHAIKDYDQAVKLEPSDPENYYLRGIARLNDDRSVLAMDDLGEALRLKPDHVRARLDRGRLRLYLKDLAGASTDFAAVKNLAPNDAALSLEMAAVYDGAGYPQDGLLHLSEWIQANPCDEALPVALNARCWIRAKLGKELALALEDCNRALKPNSRVSSYLDSRGLVYLRLGKLKDAIDDYRHALELRPGLAHSRYGLGLAQLQAGKIEEGKSSIDAAIALNPQIVAFFEAMGLTAPK